MGHSLKGKVAIVTGAGSVPGPKDREPIGNGQAAAILYAREGAALMAVDIKAEAVEETKRMIKEEGGICSVFQADVTRSQDCQAMMEECLKTYGRIDILHNNVGGSVRQGGILEVKDEDWDTVMNVNVKSILHTCQAVVPQMIKQGNGSILNVSSVASVLNVNRRFFLYAIAKAAVNKFTQCLASELADKGIRVNCVMPGLIDSPAIYQRVSNLYDGDLEKMRKDRSERVPMKRMGEPWDTAYASLFLVSNEAKYITGQILTVDGGLLLGLPWMGKG